MAFATAVAARRMLVYRRMVGTAIGVHLAIGTHQIVSIPRLFLDSRNSSNAATLQDEYQESGLWRPETEPYSSSSLEPALRLARFREKISAGSKPHPEDLKRTIKALINEHKFAEALEGCNMFDTYYKPNTHIACYEATALAYIGQNDAALECVKQLFETPANRSYLNLILAMVHIDEYDIALKLLENWESSGVEKDARKIREVYNSVINIGINKNRLWFMLPIIRHARSKSIELEPNCMSALNKMNTESLANITTAIPTNELSLRVISNMLIFWHENENIPRALEFFYFARTQTTLPRGVYDYVFSFLEASGRTDEALRVCQIMLSDKVPTLQSLLFMVNRFEADDKLDDVYALLQAVDADRLLRSDESYEFANAILNCFLRAERIDDAIALTKHLGAATDAIALKAIIQQLEEQRDVFRLENLCLQLISSHNQDRIRIDDIIEALIRLNRTEVILPMLQNIVQLTKPHKKRSKFSWQTISRLLDKFEQDRNISSLTQYVKFAIASTPKLTLDIVSLVCEGLHKLGKLKQIELAKEIFGYFQQAYFAPPSALLPGASAPRATDQQVYAVFNHVLRWSNQFQHVVDNYHLYYDHNLVYRKSYYAEVLHTFVETKLYLEGHRVHQDLQKHQVSVGNFLASYLVSIYSNLGIISEAERIYRDVLDKKLPVNPRLFKSMITAFARNNDTPAALRVVNDMKVANVEMQPEIVNSILMSHIKEPDKAVEIFNNVKRSKLPMDEGTYITMMRIHGLAGDIQAALATFDEFRSSGMTPKSEAFVQLIYAYRNSGQAKEAFANVFRLATQTGFQLDLLTSNALLSLLTMRSFTEDRMEALQKGNDFIRVMKSYGIAPDTNSYNVLMTLAANTKDADELVRVFDTMKKDGAKPDATTFQTMITFYCECDRYDDAIILFKKMHTLGLTPTLAVCRLLLDYSVFTGNSDAVVKYNEIIWSKRLHDGQDDYYAHLMQIATQANHPHTIIALFQQMQKHGISYNSTCIEIVVDAMRQIGQRNDAIALLKTLSKNNAISPAWANLQIRRFQI